VAQVAEGLPSKCETLSSTPSTKQTKRDRNKTKMWVKVKMENKSNNK
jgi:hypothetical protein